LERFGPCAEHRRRYGNVRRAVHGLRGLGDNEMADLLDESALDLETA
jgi:hypothetical protein